MTELKKLFLPLALMLGLLLGACSPTLIGDRSVTAIKPALNADSYGEALLTNKGEDLNIKLMLPPSTVCEGNFKLIEMQKSYPIIGGMMNKGSARLVYIGKWNEGQSAPCIEALDGPGGPERKVIVGEADITGYRIIQMYSCNPEDLICLKGRTYSFKAGS